MVHIRLSSLIFVLMFTLLEARDTVFKQPNYPGLLETKVITPQSDKKTIAAKEMKSNAVPRQEEGNNMRPNENKGDLKKGKVKVAKTPTSLEKRKLDVTLCKERVRSTSKKANLPLDFVPLSADYHFPNSHPPRHN